VEKECNARGFHGDGLVNEALGAILSEVYVAGKRPGTAQQLSQVCRSRCIEAMAEILVALETG